MKTPESSQAPDLIRIVSWMRVCCAKFLLAMVIAAGLVSDNMTQKKCFVRTVLAEEGDKGAVGTPDHVLNRRCRNFRERLLLLDVVQDDGGRRAEDEASSTAVEDLVGLHGRLDALDDRVRQVADLDELCRRNELRSQHGRGAKLINPPVLSYSTPQTCSSQRRSPLARSRVSHP